MSENGTSAAVSSPASGESTGVSEAVAALQAKAERKNPLANVKYGKQADAPAEETEVASPDTEFDEFVKNHKDVYEKKVGERVNKAIQDRFKNDKSKETIAQLNGRLDGLAPALEALQKRYGVAEGDEKALVDAILSDDSVYEDRAIKLGMDVDTVRSNDKRDSELKRIQAENAELKQHEEAQKREAETKRIVQQWNSEAEELKKDYPQFDLQSEMQNEKFQKYLSMGDSVRDAYENVHRKELFEALGKAAVKTAGEKIAASVAANRARPQEGAAAANAPAVVKNDVSQFTKADRQEIARRVARGEKIIL